MKEAEQELHEEALRKQAEKLERNRTHNDVVEIAVDLHQSDQADGPVAAGDARERRIALWWRGLHQRFDHWRDRFREEAEHWKARFSQQRDRVYSAIGYRMDEPDTGDVTPPAEQDQEIER